MVPHEGWIAGGLPQPGDRIDVLGITVLTTTDPLTGQEKPDLLAGYIAQDVQVLAIAQTLVKTVPKVNADGTAAEGSDSQVVIGEDGTTYETAISLTLALPPDLVAKVALIDAMEDDMGQYRIVVRQKGDADPISGKTTFSYQDIFAR
jgi:Flp pilus assembly protein CpaB